MNGKTLRGIAAAFLIGTAGVAGASLVAMGTAQAAGVRPQVGKPLQEAISLAKDGKGAAALAKVKEAEAVKGLTADEQHVIDQTKEFVAVKTGVGGGALGAKAKFANDYNAGHYRDVVGPDQDALRKAGALDEQSRLIVAQAYYEMGDYKSAMRAADGLGNSDQVLGLKMAIASKLGDTQALANTARDLVLKGQSKYWPYLLRAADRASGLSDDDTLNIYRIRLLTGNIRSADDYSTATQIAIQLGYPQEAVAIQQKGFDAKLLSGVRQQRLLDLAKKDAADQVAKLAGIEKAAQASKNGENLVQLAEIYWGIGKYQDALTTVQAGIAKGGLKDAGHAEMVKGMADVGLKKTAEASKAFKQAGADPKHKVVADLWDTYARSH